MTGTTDSLDFILLNIGYSEFNGDWNWEKIYSPFARIYYVKEGEAMTRIEGKPYLLKPGHLYLTPSFTLHDDECDSYFSLYYIHFYEKTVNKASIFDKYNFPVEINAGELDLSLIKRLQQINPGRYLRYLDPQIYDNPPTFSQYVADNNKMPLHSIVETQGILAQLMSRFLEFKEAKLDSTDSRINKSLQYIHENINEDIRLNELSALCGISKDHFIRIFKKEMRCTPLKYILIKKIEKAQLLLLTTDWHVRDIALDLSLDNISYFTRLFKQVTGKTPGEYRVEFGK